MNSSNFLWVEPRQQLIRETGGKTNFDDSHLAIEMSFFESAFLCGLLRVFKPKKIVEIGVSAGGTTAIILNTLSLLDLEYHLHSIDIFKQYVRDISKPMGYVVNQYLPKLTKNWTLYLGDVAPVPLRTIGNQIDFCIIDTQHIIPGEILDFISVFPYLSDNAIVVLHDMTRHYEPQYGTNFHRYATTALFTAIVADKIVLSDICFDKPEGLPNIAAFRTTKDTKKYIENIFLALSLPWTYLPDDKHIIDFIKGMINNYEDYLIEYFKIVVNTNRRMRKLAPLFNINNNINVLLNSFNKYIN
jgi:predicted O-methyltransferase YrrM